MKRFKQIEHTTSFLFLFIAQFFPSLEKFFELPVYAEPLAIAFVAQHIVDIVPQIKFLDPWSMS
jgi:hypothetical protein